jgi:anti-sigma factor (TIGR02949 family)
MNGNHHEMVPWACMLVMQQLQSYIDGEVDEAARRKVAAHLEECRHCGLEADVYRAIKQAIANYERPPDAAVDRLRAFAESLLCAPPGNP